MAFTGRATHDQTSEIGEDVSPIIGMISPFETPLLDRLGDAAQPAENVLHEWLEDALSPGTLTASSVITSATAAETLALDGSKLQVGDVVRYTGAASLDNEELMRVTATAVTSSTFERGVGGIGPSSSVVGATIELVSNSSLEGTDMNDDISGNRSRKINFTQIFRKPVVVSGSKRAVTNLGGVTDEFDYQTVQRSREAIRDLERAVILSETANSFGSSSAYRTMKGIWRFLTTNISSATTLTESFLNNQVIKPAWDNGAADLDFLVADGIWKDLLDGFSDSRIRTDQDADRFRSVVNRYEGSFAELDILRPDRWMPVTSLMVLASGRIKVMNLAGRSFQSEARAKTGDADKLEIIGEYTVELMNEDGHAKANQAA